MSSVQSYWKGRKCNHFIFSLVIVLMTIFWELLWLLMILHSISLSMSMCSVLPYVFASLWHVRIGKDRKSNAHATKCVICKSISSISFAKLKHTQELLLDDKSCYFYFSIAAEWVSTARGKCPSERNQPITVLRCNVFILWHAPLTNRY